MILRGMLTGYSLDQRLLTVTMPNRETSPETWSYLEVLNAAHDIMYDSREGVFHCRIKHDTKAYSTAAKTVRVPFQDLLNKHINLEINMRFNTYKGRRKAILMVESLWAI